MLRPIHDYVLVAPEKPKEVSDGGIAIPEKARMSQPRGTVISIAEFYSSQCHNDTPISVGVLVYYPPYAGAPVLVTVDGKEEVYLLIRGADIMAVETISDTVSSGGGSHDPTHFSTDHPETMPGWADSFAARAARHSDGHPHA